MKFSLCERDFLFLRHLKKNHLSFFCAICASFFVFFLIYLGVSHQFWKIFLAKSDKTILHLNAEITRLGIRIHFFCVFFGFSVAIFAYLIKKLVGVLKFLTVRVDFSREFSPSMFPNDDAFENSIPATDEFSANGENLRLKQENAETLAFFSKYELLCTALSAFWIVLGVSHYFFIVFLLFFEKTSVFFERIAVCAIFSAMFLIAFFALLCRIKVKFSIEKK